MEIDLLSRVGTSHLEFSDSVMVCRGSSQGLD